MLIYSTTVNMCYLVDFEIKYILIKVKLVIFDFLGFPNLVLTFQKFENQKFKLDLEFQKNPK
jgi:hypothetical protein